MTQQSVGRKLAASLRNAINRLGQSAPACTSILRHRYLASSQRRGRLLVVGDLHGEFEALLSSLAELAFDYGTDRVLFIGDLHDRGPDSARCLELLEHPWTELVLGNHELMLLGAVDEQGMLSEPPTSALNLWLANGGGWALKESPQRLQRWRELICKRAALQWLAERRDGQQVLLCHAEPDSSLATPVSITDRVPLTALTNSALLWGRSTIHTATRTDLSDAIMQQLLPPVADVLFTVQGHTHLNLPTWVNNQLFCDCGAVYGNRLTILDIDKVRPGHPDGTYTWDMQKQCLLTGESVKLWPRGLHISR